MATLVSTRSNAKTLDAVLAAVAKNLKGKTYEAPQTVAYTTLENVDQETAIKLAQAILNANADWEVARKEMENTTIGPNGLPTLVVSIRNKATRQAFKAYGSGKAQFVGDIPANVDYKPFGFELK